MSHTETNDLTTIAAAHQDDLAAGRITWPEISLLWRQRIDRERAKAG